MRINARYIPLPVITGVDSILGSSIDTCCAGDGFNRAIRPRELGMPPEACRTAQGRKVHQLKSLTLHLATDLPGILDERREE